MAATCHARARLFAHAAVMLTSLLFAGCANSNEWVVEHDLGQPICVTRVSGFPGRWKAPLYGAVEQANRVLQSREFSIRINQIPDDRWDHRADAGELASHGSSEVLLHLLMPRKIRIVAMRPGAGLWPTDVEARANVTGRIVRLNLYKMDRWEREKNLVAKIAGAVVHEFAHIAGYRHRGNSRTGNENSVPYVVGDLAYDLSLVGLPRW